MGEPWQRFGLQLGCCSVASSQDWPQRQWIDFRESTALVTSNAGLLILGMLTKFEGTAASTWPLVTTTGFSKHPRHEGSKWGKHRGKNYQFTHGYHLPIMSWSNPVTTYSIHPQFLHAQLLPGLCPCSAHFLDAAKVRATLRHPSFRGFLHSTFHQLICVDLS